MVVGGMHGCRGACLVAWACVVGGHVWLLGGACVVAGGMHGCGGCIGYDKIRSMSGGVRILLECILVSFACSHPRKQLHDPCTWKCENSMYGAFISSQIL